MNSPGRPPTSLSIPTCCPEVDPRETGQVVTDNQGMLDASNTRYGPLLAEVDETPL